jgi:hypothetical protein
MIAYVVLYQGREGVPEDQPDTLQVDGLGVLTSGKPRVLDSGAVYAYCLNRGVPFTDDNLPENVKLHVLVGPSEMLLDTVGGES